MPATLFRDMIKKAERGGHRQYDPKSRKWFRNLASNTKSTPAEIMKESGDRFRNRVYPGHMYMFYYDPKWKNELPYYDRFPLIFPIDFKKDHFLGLNLHYLDYRYRAILMDALYDLRNNTKMDESTKLNLSYGVLKDAAKFKHFKPTIKKYLKNHVRSRFVKVNANEWDFALFLPIQQWEKADQGKVYADSRRIIARG